MACVKSHAWHSFQVSASGDPPALFLVQETAVSADYMPGLRLLKLLEMLPSRTFRMVYTSMASREDASAVPCSQSSRLLAVKSLKVIKAAGNLEKMRLVMLETHLILYRPIRLPVQSLTSACHASGLGRHMPILPTIAGII